jgi:hypothetical protein
VLANVAYICAVRSGALADRSGQSRNLADQVLRTTLYTAFGVVWKFFIRAGTKFQENRVVI